MEIAVKEIEGSGLMDWEDRAAEMAGDPAIGPALKEALAEALERDPVEAVKNAETVYQILLQRALAGPGSDVPGSEWKWRSQPTCCWVCNSYNTRLVAAPGYGIVHECLDCSDEFLLDGAIQWVA